LRASRRNASAPGRATGIMPSVSRRPNVYSYADAGEAVIARYLIGQGVKPRKIRELVERLRERFGLWPLARAPLQHEGGLVVMRDAGRVLVDVVDHPDQLVEEGHVPIVDGGSRGARTRRLGGAADASFAHSSRSGPAVGSPHHQGPASPDGDGCRDRARGRWRAAPPPRVGLTDEEIAEAVGYEQDVETALAA